MKRSNALLRLQRLLSKLFRCYILAMALSLLLPGALLAAGEIETGFRQGPDTPPFQGRFGVNNVNYIHGDSPQQEVRTLESSTDRYGKAIEIGASMTRWVLWWYLVEPYSDCDNDPPDPETWRWNDPPDSGYQAVVDGDFQRNLETLIAGCGLHHLPLCLSSPPLFSAYSLAAWGWYSVPPAGPVLWFMSTCHTASQARFLINEK